MADGGPGGRTQKEALLMKIVSRWVGLATFLVSATAGAQAPKPEAPKPVSTAAKASEAKGYAVRLKDPARDDYGPGSYVYPSNQEYRRNSFDLREFSAKVEGDTIQFKAVFNKPIWKPPETRRSDAQRFVLGNGLYVQHVDIYIDHTPGKGFVDALPGRNFMIEEASAWDTAVVLTPRPFYLQSLIRAWAPSAKVHVPPQVKSYKNVVEVSIPVDILGEKPSESWGYVVAISGAVWENTFDAFDRLVGGNIQNALTMPVVTVAEPFAFGGGELRAIHPFVLDIIVPEGRTQKAILGNYDLDKRQLATVPAVYPNPEAHEKAVVRARASLAATATVQLPTIEVAKTSSKEILTTLREVREEIAILEKPSEEISPYNLGDVLGDKGQVVGRVVVITVYPKFILANIVEGAGKIEVGSKVRFFRSP